MFNQNISKRINNIAELKRGTMARVTSY